MIDLSNLKELDKRLEKLAEIGLKIIGLVFCGALGAVLTGFILVLGIYGLIYGVDMIITAFNEVRFK